MVKKDCRIFKRKIRPLVYKYIFSRDKDTSIILLVQYLQIVNN